MISIWLIFALLSPVFYSISSIIDKFLTVGKLSVGDYSQKMGILNLAITFILLIFVHLELDVMTLLAIVPGILWGILYMFYLKALQYEEVTRVIGIIYVFPIFVAIFAAIFLKEVLSPIKYSAILMIVIGGIMISVRSIRKHLTLSRAVPWLLVTILLEVIIEILDKYLLESLNFFQVQAMNSFGVFIACLPFIFKSFKFNKETGLVFLSQFFIGLASFFFVIAVSMTAVSIVAGVIAIQPLITLFFATVLSFYKPKFVEEEIKRKAFINKLIAIILIVVGVLILSK